MNTATLRMNLALAVALSLAMVREAPAADPPAVRATLAAAKDRKPAPEFALKDASGNPVKLSSYRGKVVLLNFWATWCHGCKQEIPWFSELQKKYDRQGFAVVGVSMDEDGWRAVKPFIDQTKVSYRMLLCDSPTAQKYAIQSLPDTFLIDREGRIAATYVGLVDPSDIESNIRAILVKP